jgi:predicted N-acetyltransferase YhbS
VPAALLDAAMEHARDRRYRRLLLAPTSGSAAFYRRAGFVPAGEQLLVLDPATLPAPPP